MSERKRFSLIATQKLPGLYKTRHNFDTYLYPFQTHANHILQQYLFNYLYIQPNALYYLKLKNYLQYIALIHYKLSLVFKIYQSDIL
jgi:hypothetical protein